jgi:hypothetical protein
VLKLSAPKPFLLRTYSPKKSVHRTETVHHLLYFRWSPNLISLERETDQPEGWMGEAGALPAPSPQLKTSLQRQGGSESHQESSQIMLQ